MFVCFSAELILEKLGLCDILEAEMKRLQDESSDTPKEGGNSPPSNTNNQPGCTSLRETTKPTQRADDANDRHTKEHDDKDRNISVETNMIQKLGDISSISALLGDRSHDDSSNEDKEQMPGTQSDMVLPGKHCDHVTVLPTSLASSPMMCSTPVRPTKKRLVPRTELHLSQIPASVKTHSKSSTERVTSDGALMSTIPETQSSMSGGPDQPTNPESRYKNQINSKAKSTSDGHCNQGSVADTDNKLGKRKARSLASKLKGKSCENVEDLVDDHSLCAETDLTIRDCKEKEEHVESRLAMFKFKSSKPKMSKEQNFAGQMSNKVIMNDRNRTASVGENNSVVENHIGSKSSAEKSYSKSPLNVNKVDQKPCTKLSNSTLTKLSRFAFVDSDRSNQSLTESDLSMNEQQTLNDKQTKITVNRLNSSLTNKDDSSTNTAHTIGKSTASNVLSDRLNPMRSSTFTKRETNDSNDCDENNTDKKHSKVLNLVKTAITVSKTSFNENKQNGGDATSHQLTGLQSGLSNNRKQTGHVKPVIPFGSGMFADDLDLSDADLELDFACTQPNKKQKL